MVIFSQRKWMDEEQYHIILFKEQVLVIKTRANVWYTCISKDFKLGYENEQCTGGPALLLRYK